MLEKAFVYDFTLPQLVELFHSWGEPEYRAIQLWKGLYQQFWQAPSEYTNFPKPLRARLEDHFSFSALQPAGAIESRDGGTLKTLFKLVQGESVQPRNLAIEAVLMRYEKRRTLCISTQAGCAMGCTFCATGQMGFARNLSSGEIVEQVIYYARVLKQSGKKVTNVVVMGMGEPFHNYIPTLAAIDRLNDPQGFNLGARRFTISTVGLVPVIRQFAAEGRQINLAVSLHAADDALRSSMLPINRKYPIEVLLQACAEYVQKTHRRITFEWALIKDVNDTPDQATRLVERVKSAGLIGACHVNVIPLNPTRGYKGEASPRQNVLAFQSFLENNGIPCTVRIRRGIEIQAGCGQLATGYLKKSSQESN